MKKHFSIAAALILLLSVTGCSANENSALNGGTGAMDGYYGVDIGGSPDI